MAKTVTWHWVREIDKRPLIGCCGHSIWGTRKVLGSYVAHRVTDQPTAVTCTLCFDKHPLLELAAIDL